MLARIKRMVALITVLFTALLLSACQSSDTVYEQMYNDNASSSGGVNSNLYETAADGTQKVVGSVGRVIIEKLYWCLRSWLVCILVVSEIIGWFLLLTFSKKNKRIKKTALFVFVFGIPIIVIAIFFFLAFYLNS